MEEAKAIHDVCNRLWKFAKEYLEKDLSADATWEMALDRVAAEIKTTPIEFQKYAAEIFNSTLIQLNEIRKGRKNG